MIVLIISIMCLGNLALLLYIVDVDRRFKDHEDYHKYLIEKEKS